jgi:hypothetical protein
MNKGNETVVCAENLPLSFCENGLKVANTVPKTSVLGTPKRACLTPFVGQPPLAFSEPNCRKCQSPRSNHPHDDSQQTRDDLDPAEHAASRRTRPAADRD